MNHKNASRSKMAVKYILRLALFSLLSLAPMGQIFAQGQINLVRPICTDAYEKELAFISASPASSSNFAEMDYYKTKMALEMIWGLANPELASAPGHSQAVGAISRLRFLIEATNQDFKKALSMASLRLSTSKELCSTKLYKDDQDIARIFGIMLMNELPGRRYLSPFP